MSQTCFDCHKTFEGFPELAVHISSSKKHSRKSKKWAAIYLMRVNKREMPKKVPVNPDYQPTEYGNENRANATVELSGKEEYQNTICPRCNRQGRGLVPVEHVRKPEAWRIGSRLAISCEKCGGNK